MLKWMKPLLSIPSHDHCKDKVASTSLECNHSPREYHRGFYPDKNKGCTKWPQALAIVLMIHAYSPTVISDWNHRMLLVISFPRMWKDKSLIWVQPFFCKITKDFFCLLPNKWYSVDTTCLYTCICKYHLTWTTAFSKLLQLSHLFNSVCSFFPSTAASLVQCNYATIKVRFPRT